GASEGRRSGGWAREAFPSAALDPLPAARRVSSPPPPPREGLRPPKCRLGERSVAPRSRNEPLGPELVLAGGPAADAAAAAGGERETAPKAPPRAEGRESERASERERAREGGEARASPPAFPPARAAVCGWVTARVPCRAAARARPRAPGTGGSDPLLPWPALLLLLLLLLLFRRGLGAPRARRRSSRSPRRGRRAPPPGRRPPARGRLCPRALPFRFSSPGWGLSAVSPPRWGGGTRCVGRPGAGASRAI
ncbi:uncharacterized protein LOC115949296, partial [Geospiza fortis]|uniref:Uncharacterized protein LOC115949296 n=1 Tax=Geospiza fortis TaxID=48883 RepID=A0A8N5F1A8_GEOFO